MRGICATHPRRAGHRRAEAWRFCVVLILGMAVTAAFTPRCATAASRTPYSELGGGSLTGDPDDGEHKSGPSLLPTSPVPSGGSRATPTYSPRTTVAGGGSPAGSSMPTGSPSEFLLPSGRAALLRALIRSVRPLAWLALSARQPWACDPLWLVTVPITAPASSGRTR